MSINIKRNDENFNLDNVTDKELFDGLLSGLVASIKDHQNFEDISDKNIRLLNDCSRKQIIAVDGNLYPQINLSTRIHSNKNILLSTNANFLVTPFNIKMIFLTENGLETSEPEELTSAFTEFMTSRFPEGNYLEKKTEYERKVKIHNKFYDDMVFGR